MRKYRTITLLLLLAGFSLSSQAAEPKGVLENPKDGAVVSGISVFSGWYCDARKIELLIDDRPSKEAAYGTRRNDTESKCGDTDNGFGLLWSFNLFGPGEHTVVALADGVEFARATFTVQVVGEGFLKKQEVPESAELILTDQNKVVKIEWQESVQNFAITDVADLYVPIEQIFAFVQGKWAGQWLSTKDKKPVGEVEFDLKTVTDKDGKARLQPIAVTLTGTGCAEQAQGASPLDVNGISTLVQMEDDSQVYFSLKVTETLTAMAGTFVFESGPCEGQEGVFTLFQK